MATTKDHVLSGVEIIEFGVPGPGGTAPSSWERFENIAPGSVVYTNNSDNKTNIVPEDKDTPLVVLYTPGDPDSFNFGLLDISPETLATLFNVSYDILTSTSTILSDRTPVNLAIRLTSRPQLGRKHIFTYYNTLCTAVYQNPFTKDQLVQIQVTADILAWTTTGGQSAKYVHQIVEADGGTIDSTLPTVNAGVDGSATGGTKALTGTATANSPKTITSTLWTQVSGPSTAVFTAPTALSTSANSLVAGVYVFKLTATDSQGIINSDTITITHS